MSHGLHGNFQAFLLNCNPSSLPTIFLFTRFQVARSSTLARTRRTQNVPQVEKKTPLDKFCNTGHKLVRNWYLNRKRKTWHVYFSIAFLNHCIIYHFFLLQVKVLLFVCTLLLGRFICGYSLASRNLS